MKNLLYILLACLMIGCYASRDQVKADVSNPGLEVAESDTTEYELIVFDPKFDTFLATQPYQKNFYSQSYYENWNQMYCVEWNIRHGNPLRYGSFYETDIPYDVHTDYGLDFNYTLYQYFQFIEKEYGIVLVSRRGK